MTADLDTVTADDLAKVFGVTRQTIQARARRNELPQPLATRPHYVWSSQQIDRFFAAESAEVQS